MKLAFIGDVHGNIDSMYETVSDLERGLGEIIGPIVQLGDLHTIRDENDLKFFPVPLKYRKTGDFPKYADKGQVPRRTYFIGGNHENNKWLSENPNGNEIISNLVYLGRSGFREIQGLNFSWASGTYSQKTFEKEKRKNKYHHFTEEDVRKLYDSSEQLDVLLLHDWPSLNELGSYIDQESVSDPETLESTNRRDIGNKPFSDLVKKLKPRYVFCGHIHVPLSLDLKIDDSTVKFRAMEKFEYNNSVCLLDPLTLNDNTYNVRWGNLSDDTESFQNFSQGSNYFKRSLKSNPPNTKDLDKSIELLRKSLSLADTGDARFMLASALQEKALALINSSPNFDALQTYKFLEDSVSNFQRSMRLCESYTSEVLQNINQLEEMRNGLRSKRGS